MNNLDANMNTSLLEELRLSQLPEFSNDLLRAAEDSGKAGVLKCFASWPENLLLLSTKILFSISHSSSSSSLNTFNANFSDFKLDGIFSEAFPPTDIQSESSESTFNPTPPSSPLTSTTAISLQVAMLLSQQTSPSEPKKKKGSIVLVGAGPGDPSLMTLAGLSALQNADVIVTDRLVHPSMLKLIQTYINPHASLTLSRKPIPHQKDNLEISASDAQSEIYATCLSALSRNLRVVRLKNGDPFVYGRGGEEVLFFEKHGYKVNVIPGISSAFAAALSARIPVTHRGVADQVIVSTGWRRDEDDDLAHLAQIDSNNDVSTLTAKKMYAPKSDPAAALPTFSANRTVVLLMAISKLDKLTGHMLVPIDQGGLGYPSTLPAAIIEKATWGEEDTEYKSDQLLWTMLDKNFKRKQGDGQYVIKGTLGEIVQLSRSNGVKHHATVVIGNVVDVLQ
ncbi:hypothetical protein HK096_010174 [Nowakowskiella sp. JEL0078]|nr:hypothetical protein HK096_010174 [Nowakowskiella sp. JEL0078]